MEHKLSHLVDAARLKTFANTFYKATGIPLSIVDPEGSILAKSDGPDIRRLCGPDRQAVQKCERGDGGVALKKKARPKYSIEKCGHGLACASAPVAVLGERVGALVAGPFFTDPPDMGSFKHKEGRFGLSESALAEALSKAAVVDESKVRAFLQCFSLLADLGGTVVQGLADATPQKGRAIGSRFPEKVGTPPRAAPGKKENERSQLEEDITANMKERVLPYLEKLKKSRLSREQASAVDMLESGLKDIMSPVMRKMQTLGLTARELAVALLLKEGRATAEIAELLGVSLRAVEYHRYNIRKKLVLDHKTNLRSHLISIT